MKRKRAFNKRQMALIDFIRRKKAEGAEVITLDEIVDECRDKALFPKVREGHERKVALATMNLLADRLSEAGVKISKPERIGRGIRCEFRI